MSRTWLRAPFEKIYGACRRTIEQDQPMLEIAITGVARRRYRCARCARAQGEKVPKELPPRAELKTDIVPMHPLRNAMGDLPFDYKRAAGKDE